MLTTSRNNFDALRLGSAVLVIIGHSYVLLGAGAAPRILGVSIHTLGVYAFFAISGYLIYGSALNDPRPHAFLFKRALRLYPAMAATIFATVFVLGPLTTTLQAGDYFRADATWAYFHNLLFIGTYELPGVFSGPSYARDAVNGSLWTIGIEVLCYLGALAIVSIITRTRPRSCRIILPAMIAAGALLGSIASPTALTATLEVVGIFFTAATLRSFAITSPPPLHIAGIAGIGWVAVAASGLPVVVTLPLFTIAVVALGGASTPGLRRIGTRGDISYGLYLWGYPVQQLVIHSAPSLTLIPSLLLTLMLTTVLATASWRLIEQPALTLKRFLRAPPESLETAIQRLLERESSHSSAEIHHHLQFPRRTSIARTFRTIGHLEAHSTITSYREGATTRYRRHDESRTA